MEFRDVSILTQVAFKEAGECARSWNLDLTAPDGQATFEVAFGYLVESLFASVHAQARADSEQSVSQMVQQAFPGATVASQAPQQQGWGAAPTPAYVPQAPMNGTWGPHNYQLTVKGTQYGPLPEWLYQSAAADGVHEIYDNRDQPPGSRRPMFKSTSGGRDAPAYWAPK